MVMWGLEQLLLSSKLHIYENTAFTNFTAGFTIEQDGAGDAIKHNIY